MNSRTLGFLFLALVLAAAAGYSNWRYLLAASDVQAGSDFSPRMQDVVVARTNLEVSTPLVALRLAVVAWPENLVPEGSFRDIGHAVGRLPRRFYVPGEPILETGLFPKGSIGGLSPLIQSGFRAMSVQVDEIIGIAGFVSVGSTVDVLATLRRTVESEAFSQVILQGVRVLAVDRTLEPRKTESDERVDVVTLEVTPTQAKKLAFASAQGSIQLALRNPGDAGQPSSVSVGAPNLKGQLAEAPSRPKQVVVLRGLEQTSQSFPPARRGDRGADSSLDPALFDPDISRRTMAARGARD